MDRADDEGSERARLAAILDTLLVICLLAARREGQPYVPAPKLRPAPKPKSTKAA